MNAEKRPLCLLMLLAVWNLAAIGVAGEYFLVRNVVIRLG